MKYLKSTIVLKKIIKFWGHLNILKSKCEISRQKHLLSTNCEIYPLYMYYNVKIKSILILQPNKNKWESISKRNIDKEARVNSFSLDIFTMHHKNDL